MTKKNKLTAEETVELTLNIEAGVAPEPEDAGEVIEDEAE